MAELTDRIQASLGDAYRLQRELGGGGMSRVFLAHDTALDRDVVIKVISPELAASVSLERFRREILLAARLQHPHIVPVLSAGEAAGLPYYTMPFIDGLSLRRRLEAGAALPVDEATAILKDVARALAFAHEHGVVHRDIKPDNVLLAGGSATVTDFGIAKALSSARAEDGETLTMIGTSLGTPAYMAPEQVAADPTSDHRVDIYAFGAMAYEMLTGHSPFHGRSQQQTLTAHLTEAPVPLRVRSPETPPALSELVMHCLAKTPADRPQTAAELVRALESLGATASGQRAAQRFRAPRAAMLAGAAVLLAAAAFAGSRLLSSDAPQLDRGVMAVVPFRIASADPSLHYLREGMLDLLAAKLTGEGGLRATEPRTLLAAWQGAGSESRELDQRAALSVARDLGAGTLLLGDVVGTPNQLVLNASLLEVPGGASLVRVSVQGAPDSIAWFVDQLAARLLTEVSGEGAQRAASLTSTPLPALRAYLDGQAKLRRGQTFAAREEFLRAVDTDSTFALAGIGLHQASVWGDEDGSGTQRGLRIAWAGRDRLGPRDRALLDAIAGPDYPEASATRDILRAREQYRTVAPDRPDAWYLVGDHLFHFGHVHDLEAPREQALAAFKRAVELDSNYVVPMLHGLELAVLLEDTATVARFERLRLRSDTARHWIPIYRWFAATRGGDSVRARQILDSLEAADPFHALRIVQHTTYDGAGAAEVRRLTLVAAERATASGSVPGFTRSVHEAFMMLGRPREARAMLDTMFAGPDSELNALVTRVRNGLVGGADSADAAEAVVALERLHRSPLPDEQERHRRTRAILRITEPWKLAHGDTSTVRRSLAEMRAAVAAQTEPAWDSEMDVAVVEAMYADLTGAPNARASVDRLDGILRGLDYGLQRVTRREMANLVAARLLEKQGDLRRALAAARRRGDAWVPNQPYLAEQLREEGRIAALLGEREQAIAAYRHYLALRANPEPQLREEVDAVRRELAKLEGESAGK